MKKTIVQLIVGGSLLAGVVGSATAQYINPLRGDIGTHDPIIIKEQQTGTYWSYSTGNYIAAKTSRDRITWRNTGSGLSAPRWINQYVPQFGGTHYWAPDVIFRDNKYWLYYSMSVFAKNTSAIGLATSPTLTNPRWTDQGVVVYSKNGDTHNCIDPAVFEDDDGKVWMSFGSWWSGIKLVECNPETGKPDTARPEYISLASRDSSAIEAGGMARIEAPFIAKWGYYYLFVSWDRCCEGCDSKYKIVVGRATDIRGPYVDKDGVDMLDGGGELIDAGDNTRKGPGHNGIFIDNDTLFCVNHYYDANSPWCASTLQIRPLYFDDGWPSFTGSIIEAPKVETKEAAARPAIKTQYGQKVRVAIPLSGTQRSHQAGQKMFTITGKALPAGHTGNQRSAPQGIVIIDSNK